MVFGTTGIAAILPPHFLGWSAFHRVSAAIDSTTEFTHAMSPFDPPLNDEIPLPRLRTISHLWATAAVLASAGVAALAIDMPLARWIYAGHCPNWVQKIFSLNEVLGHGLGIVFIAVLIWVLDPWHRYAVPRILAAA